MQGIYVHRFTDMSCFPISFPDFPESKAAIEDLKFCLERTNQRQQLLTSLKSAFESRLLHPGENASATKERYLKNGERVLVSSAFVFTLRNTFI